MSIARPTLTSESVIKLASEIMLSTIEDKIRQAKYTQEDRVVYLNQLQTAMCNNSNGIGRVQYLVKNYKWNPSDELVSILSPNSNIEARCLEEAIRNWVILTGTRFPAKKGETVYFKYDGSTRKGKVEEVINIEAKAIVVIERPKADTDLWCRVNAEDVVAHIKGEDKVSPILIREHVGFQKEQEPAAA